MFVIRRLLSERFPAQTVWALVELTAARATSNCRRTRVGSSLIAAG